MKMQGNKRRFLIFLAFMLAPVFSVAQKVTISGYVKDAVNKEVLLGANVYTLSEEQGTVSNSEGYFKLKIPAGDSSRIRISYMGYKNRYLDVVCWRDTTFDITLKPDQQQLQEVVVAANTGNKRFKSGLMNVNYLSPEEVKMSPGLLGEPDVIQVLQLKPGMQSGSEGNSGFYVRGGQADQNLVLFDGAPVYNPSHLFGMFSIFSADAIDKVRLYKGGFPARFGGRLSSVLDVDVRPGSKKEFKVKGGTGLISSRLSLEGPILKDKVSFLVSGRRTYFDAITKEINKANAGVPDYQPIPDYYFYDISVKLHAQLSPDDQISFSAYAGRDRFNFRDNVMAFDFLWGNKVGVLQWKHAFNKKLFHTLSASYSGYQYRIRNRFNEFTHSLGSGISDFNLNSSFQYEVNSRHSLSFGFQYTYHVFDLLRQEEADEDGPLKLKGGEKDQVVGHEAAIYLADSWKLNDQWSIEAGLRVSGFLPGGIPAAGGKGQDKLHLGIGDNIGDFIGFEPRLTSRYQLMENLALKASYSRANQYVHLVSSSGSSLPANFWYPSGKDILPQQSEQYAAGADLLLAGGAFLLSNEVYYRHMENQIDFRNGAELFGNPELTNDLVFGQGWAYGNEFYLEKKKGKTTGWIGYTLSWTMRKFDEINEGKVFPATQDRRHDFTFVLRHQFNERLSFSGNWVFCSGNATSLPQSRLLLQGQRGTNPRVVPVYSERNAYRLDHYHRLDLGLIYKFQPRWGEADLSLGVYNTYNRRNPYFIYFEQEKQEQEGSLSFVARQISLFPVLPSISFNYSF